MIRLIHSRAAAQPRRPLATLARELTELRGRLDALDIGGGEVLTENGAVLQYIGDKAGNDTLLPGAGMERYRVIEMLAFFPLVVVGFVWGRRGIFGDVDGNSRMLRGWAILAAVVIAAVGIPWGCAEIGAREPRWATGLNATNELVGMLTGPGILAAISLACRPLQSHINASSSLPHLAQPLVALGKRSMSG